MIGELIGLVLSNVPVVCCLIWLLVAGIAVARLPKSRESHAVAERFLGWYCFIVIGVYLFYNFVGHVFYGETLARFIGWANSPFQAEVGYASLGFSVVGLFAFRGGHGIRFAAIVAPAMFLWGAACGHAYQMITAGNFAPGNAGSVFWTDIAVPLIGFVMLKWRYGRIFPPKGE